MGESIGGEAVRMRKKRDEPTGLLYLAPEAITPNPGQPRRQFDPAALDELAESIRQYGILQPLSVRRRASGTWELIAGERRLRAAKLAGLRQVPCLRVEADREDAALLALIENVQRRDLNFLEEAVALARIMETYGMSQEALAARIGRSQPSVANKLRLLRLPEELLLRMVDEGLTERHARALLPLGDPELQSRALDYILEHRLNVAQTDEYVTRLLTEQPVPPRKVTYVLKDVRIFLNTVSRGLELMRQAGVPAACDRTETEEDILLSIRIPKSGQK